MCFVVQATLAYTYFEQKPDDQCLGQFKIILPQIKSSGVDHSSQISFEITSEIFGCGMLVDSSKVIWVSFWVKVLDEVQNQHHQNSLVSIV